MAGIGVMGCVNAVVSTFHGGAELMQSIKERRDPKKRRKERDMEQAFEEKMLHRSLVEGANQCHNIAAERYKRFGSMFDRGDQIATSELKDVVISLQTEVISALQIAKASDHATLDLSRLHEYSIMNKTNAIRAMDGLCQRLMASMPADGELRPDDRPPRCSTSGQSRHSNESFDSLSSLPAMVSLSGGSNGGQPRSLQRSPHVRHSSENTASRAPSQRSPGSTMNWTTLPPDWYADDFAKRGLSDEERDEETLYRAVPPIDRSERMSKWTFHDSAFGGSESGSRHGTNASLNSTLGSDDQFESSFSGVSNHERQADPATSERNILLPLQRNSPDSREGSMPSCSRDLSPPQTAPQRSLSISYDPEEGSRADSAPEVVTKEFESMLTLSSKSSRQKSTSQNDQQPPMNHIHPAFRDIYMDVPAQMGPEPDQVWAPLTRPAKFNNYHGFCRGAWQTRQAVQEGLAIAMIPNSKGVNVPHWKCKQCEFRSKGLNNSKVLPDQVYYDKCGIRYRWLFLAKSHVRARVAHNKPELYAYGCVFCAAEGRETNTHNTLEGLMSHITSKHKTHMMTPEVRGKTKCVVGGTPDRSGDWDINVPQSHSKSVSGVVSEFFLSASTGLSKYS